MSDTDFQPEQRLLRIAVVGASGAVGAQMMAVLEARHFPIAELIPVASARSAGKEVEFCGKPIKVVDLAEFDFAEVDVALFSAGAQVSAEHAPRAVEAGCVVIDNTSQFRYDDNVPLVVPEVNPEAAARHAGIIANPNCSTIQMLVALWPIHCEVVITRINVATYQSVSGAGQQGIEELRSQSDQVLRDKQVGGSVFPKQIAFNIIPHIDVFEDSGYTREEMKMVWETRKIFGEPKLAVNPTCVRVPVFLGHAEAVHIETRRKISADKARKLLQDAPGVKIIDDACDGGYPTPAVDAAGGDAVFVGRIREDISHCRGLNLWVVSDNLRKGAALNSVQIAELLLDSL